MSELTFAGLVEAYQTDPASKWHELRHRTRVNDGGILRRIKNDEIITNWMRVGDVKLSDLRAISIRKLHTLWSKNGAHIPMAHAIIAKVRTIVNFGLVDLENRECERLSAVLHRMKFPQGPGRTQTLVVEHINALRALAHDEGCPSIALAQAIQFEGTFRQKDIIGEWVPIDEKGVSDVTSRDYGKWLRGIRWHKISHDLVLTHITSKKQKEVTVDLKLAPMVVEELRRQFPGCISKYQVRNKITGETRTELLVHRTVLPASGPVIVDEESGLPYLTHKFRRRWRDLARAVGIPDDVQQRDTRATAMTEAAEAGADRDDIKESATHSDGKMTDRYIRGRASEMATARTMKVRASGRVKTA